MSAEAEQEVELEIGHVLFIDIIAYSKLVIDEQRAIQRGLNVIVRKTNQFRISDASGKLVSLPTGDGMALVFRDDMEAPVRCAMEIARALRADPAIRLRMGIHSGPVSDVTDVNERANVAGDGINIAQRIMDCGDAGHILISKRVADDLANFGRWRSKLHDLGTVEVKHGVKIDIFNLVGDDIGNRALPEKIARKHAEEAAATKLARARRRLFVIGSAAAALVAVSVSILAYRMRTQVSALTAIPDQSVAVLPFENLSGDTNNAFLSVGIQDEIITRLSKIAALKVISRTSTAQYGTRPANLPQIAKELGVAAILEGSIQRVGSQIRVNVQLIRAMTDAHLWADTYDRELIDVLKVESDVAQEIASKLRATLTPVEKERLERKPTTHEEAYAFYLKAIEAQTRAIATWVPLEEAQHFLEQAIGLDPKFALAHASLSRIHSWIFTIYQPLDVHKRASKKEAEEALRLQPDLAEAHLAMGTYLGRVEYDFTGAMREYAIAKEAAPNDSALLRLIAQIETKHGDFRQAINDFEASASLDPRNADTYDGLGNAYGSINDWAGAERAKKRSSDLTTESIAGHFVEKMSWAGCYYELTGSFDKMNEALAGVSLDPKDDPDGLIAVTRFSAYLQQRRFEEAKQAIAKSPVTIFEGWNSARATKNQFLGVLAMVRGDMQKATPLLQADLDFARRELVAVPDSANRHAMVATLCGYLGQKDEAIREAKIATELLPVEKDAFLGPRMLYTLAEVYGRVGDQDAAIDLLERLLRTPAGVTLLDLKNDWNWDPLRKNPRFQKILASPEPKLVYR